MRWWVGHRLQRDWWSMLGRVGKLGAIDGLRGPFGPQCSYPQIWFEKQQVPLNLINASTSVYYLWKCLSIYRNSVLESWLSCNPSKNIVVAVFSIRFAQIGQASLFLQLIKERTSMLIWILLRYLSPELRWVKSDFDWSVFSTISAHGISSLTIMINLQDIIAHDHTS